MYYAIEIACVLAEVWMTDIFLYYNCHGERKRGKVALPVYAAFAVGLMALSLVGNAFLLRIAFVFFAIWILAVFLFGTGTLNGCLMSLVFCLIVTATDVLTSTLFSFLGLDISLQMQLSTLGRGLYLVVDHIVLFGIVFAVCMLNRKSQNVLPVRLLLPELPCWGISILLCCHYTLFLRRRYPFIKISEFHPISGQAATIEINFSRCYNEQHRKFLRLR